MTKPATAPQLQLKNIQYAAFASHETHCYSASLYVDGKRVALVDNDGHGGSDRVDWLDKNAEARVIAYFKSLPTFDYHGMALQPDLEQWCCEAVNDHLTRKEASREARKAMTSLTVVDTECGDGQYRAFKMPFTPENVSKVASLMANKGRRHFVVSPEFIRANPTDWLEKAHAQLAI